MAKGKEKKIRANTYGMRVMRELFFCRIIRKQLLLDGENDYEYTYKRKKLKSFVKDGYVGEVVMLRHTYCYMTEKGFRYLMASDNKYVIPAEVYYKNHKFFQSKFDDQVRVGETVFCLSRSDDEFSVLPDTRLPFSKFVEGNVTARLQPWQMMENGKAREFDFDKSVVDGIFFPAPEVRDVAKQMGKQDFMMMARFTGIMILNRQVFVLYDMMNRMMRWYESCESSTLSVIKEILMNYASKYRLRLQEVNAICLGQRLDDVKNLVWGRSPERPTKENEVKIRNLSSQVLWAANTNLYRKLYYVPIGRGSMLKELERIWNDILNDRITREELNKAFVEKGWLQLDEDGEHREGTDGNGHDVYRVTSLEIMKLNYMLGVDEFVLITFRDYVQVMKQMFGQQLVAIFCVEETADGIPDFTKINKETE